MHQHRVSQKIFRINNDGEIVGCASNLRYGHAPDPIGTDAAHSAERQVGRGVFSAAGRIAVALLAGCAAARAQAVGCPATGGGPTTLASVAPRLELRLADGRTIRLAGLEAAAATPSDPGRADSSRDALAALLKGHALSISTLSDRPDRWGRLAAWAFVADGAVPGGIAAAAIAAGLGRYHPEPAAAPCRAELLAAEETARRARLGLWRDPYYSVLAIDDPAAFAVRAGTNVIVEARLVAVERGPYRNKLRFAASRPAPRGGRMLVATIVPRAMKTFEAQGVDFSSLIGRTLRLRGLLDQRFGPQVELQGPDDVEVLPVADAPSMQHPN